MNLKRGLKPLNFLLIAIGTFIIIIQPMSTTGAVIDISTATSRIWFFIGLGLILGGIVLFIIKPENLLERLVSEIKPMPETEKAIYKKSIIRYDKKLDRLKKVPYSIRDAVIQGLHTKDAKKILQEANENVSSGYWIELDAFRERAAENQEEYPDATSIARYWGSKEYEGLSRRKLDDAYKRGEIGKTHELIRGSDIYPKRDLKTKKLVNIKPVSIPKSGARVLHRHWEITQMHNYQKNPRKKGLS